MKKDLFSIISAHPRADGEPVKNFSLDSRLRGSERGWGK